MDADGNGRVTWKEYKFYVTRPNPDAFLAADLNGDRRLELFEWVAFQDRQHPELAKPKRSFKDEPGRRFKYRDGQWYKRQGDFWYQFRDGKWQAHAPAWGYHGCYSSCYDYRGCCRGWDYDRWRYGYGFSYYHGSHSGYGFGIGVSRGWYW